MSLNANKVPTTFTGSTQEPLEAGAYPARLVGVMLIGIHKQRPYQGQEKAPALMFRTTYELLDEYVKDEDGNEIEDKPRWITEEFPFYSLKSERAKSTKRYFSLDPNGEMDGDWAALLGTPCLLTITKSPSSKPGDNRVYNNISNVSTMRPREAEKAPDLINPTFMFDFYEPDMDVYKAQPNWIKDKIKEAVDYPGSVLEGLVDSLPEDDQTNDDEDEQEEAPVPKKTTRTTNKKASDKTDW